MTIGTTRPGDALSDTQRRFLAAVMERVPRELVHEVYLFAPMKQGGVETGIAVVAIGDRDSTASAAADPAAAVTAAPDEVVTDVGPAAADASDSPTEVAPPDDPSPDDPSPDDPSPDDPSPDDGAVDAADDSDAPDIHALADDEETAGGDVGDAQPAPARPPRFTVFTARYRLQLKGPDRGKWYVDVVEEADAPLVTVDAVVRGVHRRSGEPSEVERLAPHDLARALGEVPWTSGS